MANNFDAMRMAVQAVFPTNDVLMDDKDEPSIMVYIPAFRLCDVLSTSDTSVHPAFRMNGKEIAGFYMGKYQTKHYNGSIVENAAAMGANVPEKLVKLLAAGKAAVEKDGAETVIDAALGGASGQSGKNALEKLDYDELVELACQMGLTVKDGESRAELLSEIIKCAVEHESKQ